MISRIEIKLIVNTEHDMVLSRVPVSLFRPKDACTRTNNITGGFLCTSLWSNLWRREGRPNHFLKIGIREESLSIIKSLSAVSSYRCHRSIASILAPPYRSRTALYLFSCHFPFIPLLLSSALLLAFWLISPCTVLSAFPCVSRSSTTGTDNPEWKPDPGPWGATSASLPFPFIHWHMWSWACMDRCSVASKSCSSSYLWPICILPGSFWRLLHPPAYPSHLTEEKRMHSKILEAN